MLAIRTILHPTDFSEQSENAFHLACALSRDHGARIVALHVAVRPTIAYGEGVVVPDPPDFLDEVRGRLDRVQAPAGDVRVDRRLEEGDPAMETLRVAREIGADLIVMGTHGRTGFARLLMGSVAEEVVRKSDCPVLTVKTPFAEAVPESRRETVAAVGAL
jgi:nucleotide-binding universal stress UspA family protein